MEFKVWSTYCTAVNENYAGTISSYTPTKKRWQFCTWKNNCILLSIIISDYEKTNCSNMVGKRIWWIRNMQERFLAVWANVWYSSDNLKMIHKGNWDYFY